MTLRVITISVYWNVHKGVKIEKKSWEKENLRLLNIKLIRSQASCWITTLFELYAFKTPWLTHCCMKLMWQRFWQPGSTFPSRHVRPCRYNVRTCADTCIRHWLCILSLWRRTNAGNVCLETLHGGQFTSKTPIFHLFACQVFIGQFNKPITFKVVV